MPQIPGQKISACPFCSITPSSAAAVLGTVYAVEDTSPVSLHHMLVIPFRHCPTWFDMTETELCDARQLITTLRRQILARDRTVTGFNIGVNCGEDAGQTIWHAHIHLIPRRKNDTPAPRGGVRGVIPDKMGY